MFLTSAEFFGNSLLIYDIVNVMFSSWIYDNFMHFEFHLVLISLNLAVIMERPFNM